MKKVLALALAVCMVFALAATSAHADEKIPVRISCSNGANDTVGIGYGIIGEKLEELSGGVFDAEVYYDGTYCSSTEALMEMAKDNLEIGGGGATYVIEYLPQYGFLQMAYLYDSAEQALEVLNGEIGAKIFEDCAQTIGQRPLQAYYYGSRNVLLTKDREVKTPDDLKDIKMRTNGTESMFHMMSSMGSNPVGISLSETYTALQTGVADGQENPIQGCLNYKFLEVSKAWTYTEHYFDCSWLCCSNKWFESLTPELQDVVREAVAAGCQYITDTILETEKDTDQILADAGVSVYKIDKTPFKEAAVEYYSQFYDQWDVDTLNEILALSK